MLTLEEKERMMRDNEQISRMKTQGGPSPDRSIPFMSMTPMSFVSKDQPNPSQSFHGMSTSQTMPSFIRPTIMQPVKAVLKNSAAMHTMDLTASLMNKINSFTTPQAQIPVKESNNFISKTAAAELDDLLN